MGNQLRKESSPDSQQPSSARSRCCQELDWPPQVGHAVLLLNINSFSEHQHETQPLCDCGGTEQTQKPQNTQHPLPH